MIRPSNAILLLFFFKNNCIVNTLYAHALFLYRSLAGTTKVVRGEGMPIYRNPMEKGNLYIKFDVTFPDKNFLAEKQFHVCTLLSPNSSSLKILYKFAQYRVKVKLVYLEVCSIVM